MKSGRILPDELDQLAHDLLGEAHELILAMALTGRADKRAADLIARIRSCAVRAHEVGKDKTAQYLNELIIELEKPPGA